jgi:hypothetical protein
MFIKIVIAVIIVLVVGMFLADVIAKSKPKA